MLPCTDVEKAVHPMHVLAVVAAGVPEYVALPQFVHKAGPGKVLYWPGRQAAHVPPLAPVYPALHVHAACALLAAGDELLVGQVLHVPELVAAPTVEYVFGPQSVHTADPVPALYLPAAQPVQVPPSGPVNPMLHVHAPTALPPDPDELLDGQVVHTPDPVAPGVVEYVPAPQSVHVAAPVDVLYFPATQFTHGPPFGPEAPALQVQLAKVPLPAGE